MQKVVDGISDPHSQHKRIAYVGESKCRRDVNGPVLLIRNFRFSSQQPHTISPPYSGAFQSLVLKARIPPITPSVLANRPPIPMKKFRAEATKTTRPQLRRCSGLA
jgi:hypothetical protein